MLKSYTFDGYFDYVNCTKDELNYRISIFNNNLEKAVHAFEKRLLDEESIKLSKTKVQKLLSCRLLYKINSNDDCEFVLIDKDKNKLLEYTIEPHVDYEQSNRNYICMSIEESLRDFINDIIKDLLWEKEFIIFEEVEYCSKILKNILVDNIMSE